MCINTKKSKTDRQMRERERERERERDEGNVLFNNTLNTFHFWLCSIGHMVKDHSDNKRGNLLLPLLFSNIVAMNIL